MSDNPFQSRQPSVAGNSLIREPQRETYFALKQWGSTQTDEREVGVVLPVGCGKSGCIALAPFAFESKRTLVVAPGLNIADQLYRDFDPTRPATYFYAKCSALTGAPFPEPVEIRGTTTNRGDLDEAQVVITNIQQLQGESNRWLVSLPTDYFDLILFDEGHHSVADTWEQLKNAFPAAKIVNFSATPLRADGQKMSGRVIYSYSIFRAIQAGFVKRLRAQVLNPKTLRYVREDNGTEIEVSLDEVRALGEQDADFRRSILTSKETLTTIVDASIRELDRIRAETGDSRHKIIASALNFAHCHQIVAAYQAKGRTAGYVHSKEDGTANARVMKRLENHELDVIVQVRKLGEGFDHPFLSVAAVFSVFASLAPFVQFVGRIMRVIEQNNPNHPKNQGTVIFHAGANIARRWEDFQDYSEADQAFFDQLLPMEGLDFTDSSELTVEPVAPRSINTVEVRAQSDVHIEEIPLLENDPAAMAAIQMLRDRGYSPEDVSRTMRRLDPVPTTKANERKAARAELDSRVKTEAARILAERQINPGGSELDRKRLGKTNLIVLKSAIDAQVNRMANRGTKERHEFTRSELDAISADFGALVEAAVSEIFDGH